MSRVDAVVALLTSRYGVYRVYGAIDNYREMVAGTDNRVVLSNANRKPVVTYNYKGQYYNVTQLAGLAQVSPAVVRRRLEQGKTVEQIVEMGNVGRQSNMSRCKYEWPVGSGRRYNLRQLANIANIPYGTLYSRVQSGKSITEIMEG